MNLTPALVLIRHFEGFRSRPYLCSAGVPTIGWGSTAYADGTRVTLLDAPINRADADDLLEQEVQTRYLPGVLRCCPLVAAHDGRLCALVSFAYNLGVGRLQTSTLRRKVNEQDWDAAKLELMKWTRGGGRVLPGLVKRRAAEAALL